MKFSGIFCWPIATGIWPIMTSSTGSRPMSRRRTPTSLFPKLVSCPLILVEVTQYEQNTRPIG